MAKSLSSVLETPKESQQVSGPIAAPWILLIIYGFVMCCTGQSIAAVDPLQEMLKANGAFAHLDDQIERETAIKSCVGIGLSFSVLGGFLVGLFLDVVGPKITAIVGIILQVSGFGLLFLASTKLYLCLGSIFLGLAFQAILNSHMCISCFFPENLGLVLAFLGAAPDVSLFIPGQMLAFSSKLGENGVQKAVIPYMIFVSTVCLVADCIFVPLLPFEYFPVDEDDKSTAGLSDVSCGTRQQTIIFEQIQLRQSGTADYFYGLEEAESCPEQDIIGGTCKYWSMSLKDHLKTSHYWVFVPYFVANFCRRKNFATNIRSMFAQISGETHRAGLFADVFNGVVSFGFLPAIVWGLMTDRYGICFAMIVCNVFGLAVSFLPMIPVLGLQAVTIFCYVCNSSYTFGILFAYCAITFGSSTLASLQGIASSSAGLTSLFMDAGWNEFIAYQLHGSFTKANLIITCVGLVMFATPLYIILNPPPMGPSLLGKVRPRIVTMGQVFDRHSLAIMQYRTGPTLAAAMQYKTRSLRPNRAKK